MNSSLVDFLNEIKPTDEAIEVATRSFISEISDDALPEVLRHRLAESAGIGSGFEGTLIHLERSPKGRRDMCLIALAFAWEQSENRKKIRAAFQGTQLKLPVVESALLALVAMYGMYLVAMHLRDKPNTTVRRIVRKEDDSFEVTEEIVFDKPESPVSAFKAVVSKCTDLKRLLFGDSKDE